MMRPTTTFFGVCRLLVVSMTILCVEGASPRRAKSASKQKSAPEAPAVSADEANRRDSLFLQALALEREGDVTKASELLVELRKYKQDPGINAKELGRLYMQAGLREDARDCFHAAVALHPDDPDGYHGLGLHAHTAGLLDVAEKHYREALRLAPTKLITLNNLGRLLIQARRYAEAEPIYREVLRVQQGNDRAALVTLTKLQVEMGRAEDAWNSLQQLLTSSPTSTLTASELTDIFTIRLGLGRAFSLRFPDSAELAEALLRDAVAMNPGSLDALNLLAVHLTQDLSRATEALALYRRCAELVPSSPLPWENMGVLLQSVPGRERDAEQALEAARERGGDSANVLKTLGLLLLNRIPDRKLVAILNESEWQGDVAKCKSLLRQAATKAPSDASIISSLALLARKEGHILQSAELYASALEVHSLEPFARVRLAGLRVDLCDWRERDIEEWRLQRQMAQLVDRMRDHRAQGRPLTRSLRSTPLVDPLEAIYFRFPPPLFRHLMETLSAITLDDATVAAAAAADMLEDQGEQVSSLERGRQGPLRELHGTGGLYSSGEPASTVPGNVLRVGYVSSDFREHPVGKLVSDVFRHHDRAKFEVYCYSLGGHSGGDIYDTIASTCHHFYRIPSTSSAPVLAKFIQGHRIQVLVDLNGHTSGNRMDIFALRPAPLQLSFLGFPGTSGASFIDYIVVDDVVAPNDSADQFSERWLRLPASFFVNSHMALSEKRKSRVSAALADAASPGSSAGEMAPSSEVTRASLGIPEDAFVFACFNKMQKIVPEIFAVWMHILSRVPNSILWMLSATDPLDGGTGGATWNLREEAKAAGVSPARLLFTGHVPSDTELQAKALADLVLDTPFYNAHSVAVDMAWAGIPMLIMPTDQMAGRISASIWLSTGCSPGMVVSTLKEYEDVAVAYGSAATCSAQGEQPAQQCAGRWISGRASSIARLAEIRSCLQRGTNMSSPSSLFDTGRWVRHFETGLTMMWKEYTRSDSGVEGTGDRGQLPPVIDVGVA
eukprot:jgi/Mesvir1/6848/Mv09021-RA.1